MLIRTAASPLIRSSSCNGRGRIVRIRCASKAATARRIRTAIRRAVMTEAWPWLTFAGLGAFHGLNPAMGWLFAVALGLHRQSRTVVMVSLIPIAVGHAVSVAAVAGVLVLAGALVPHNLVRVSAGVALIAWAAYDWRFGHHHRVR